MRLRLDPEAERLRREEAARKAKLRSYRSNLFWLIFIVLFLFLMAIL